jgi:Arc/MetJ family transcription regulator
MKMTMHIDDALLENVIRLTGAASKTEAVHLALKEMDRKARLREFGRKGLGLTRAELMEAVDPSYDLMALRVAEGSALYGKSEVRAPVAAPAARKPADYRKVIARRRKR